MNQDVSSNRSGDMRFPREETLTVAALLAFAGGYIDAYTWITHRVFANAQTANMLFLWIHAMAGEWAKALNYLPSLTAFVLGVIMACWLRRLAGANAAPISLLVEISFLILVAILHNRLPGVAGTLGISFVAAMQAASFPRVEAWSYSSVMATTNLRQAIEGMFNALTGSVDPRPLQATHGIRDDLGGLWCRSGDERICDRAGPGIDPRHSRDDFS